MMEVVLAMLLENHLDFDLLNKLFVAKRSEVQYFLPSNVDYLYLHFEFK